jgi:cysteine sulfinate desulfinase/cysteine desulfurase-like protein
MSRIYLDHAATTPMVPRPWSMTRELTRVGNASSPLRAAGVAWLKSPEAIAARVGAHPQS